MKRVIMMVAISCFACGLSMSHAAEFGGVTGIMFDWWGDTRDNDARQLVAPIRLQGGFNDLSVTLLTAYADTVISGQANSSLDHLLDTKLMATYELIGKLPVDLVLGLDLNLPTGKTDLTRAQLDLIMDPDLISINNYGEGFDVNLTLAAAKEWGRWVAGVGVGYLWRGGYDFSSQMNLTDYKPGDIFNINAELRYYLSNALQLRLFGRQAWYDNDTVRGAEYYQQGDFSLIGLGLNYSRPRMWDAGMAVQGIFRGRNYFQGSSGSLADSHSDEWICDMVFRYFINETTAIRSILQGRYFSKTATATEQIGMREKLSLGIGVTTAFTPKLEAGLDVKGFFKHDDEATAPEYRNARDYQGVSVMMRIAGRF